MALPKLKKLWTIDENIVGASSQSLLECHQRTLFQLKESLVNLPSPWSVSASSDSSTASSTDNWSSFSNLVWSTTNFSWIVLKHPRWPLEVLISLNNSSSSLASFYLSYGGLFSGGSISSRPTAADEIVVGESIRWIGTDTSSFNSWIHTWQSKDGYGSNMILIATSEGQGKGMFWSFDEVDSSSFRWANKQFTLLAFQTDNSGNAVMDINELMKTDSSGDPAQIYGLDSTILFCGCPLKDPTADIFSKKSTRFNLPGSTQDEYVTIGNVTELNFAHTDEFSISFWFRSIPRTSSFTTLVSKRLSSSSERGYAINLLSDGKLQVQLIHDDVSNNSIILDTENEYGEGNWHHVVMTYSGNEDANGVTLYVDNVSVLLDVINNNLNATIASSAPFQISGLDGGNNNFFGSISDVSVFDTEISSSEVSNIYRNGNPPDVRTLTVNSNLVGYWLMGDNDSNPTITDLSTSGNNGTMTNMGDINLIGDSPGNPLLFFKVGGRNIDVEIDTSDQFTRRVALGTPNKLGTGAGSALPIIPIHFVSGYGYRGFHGYLTDIFWGTQAFDATPGNTYPNAVNNRELAQFHHIILPWLKNSVVPLFGINNSQPHDTYNGQITEIDAETNVSDVKFYLMTGIDSGGPSNTVTSWLVRDKPDLDGYAASPVFGGPVTDIAISNEYSNRDRDFTFSFGDISELRFLFDASKIPNGNWPGGQDNIGNTLIQPTFRGNATSIPVVSNNEIVFNGTTSRRVFVLDNIDTSSIQEFTLFCRCTPATAVAPPFLGLFGIFPLTNPQIIARPDYFFYGTFPGTFSDINPSQSGADQTLFFIKTATSIEFYRDNTLLGSGSIVNQNIPSADFSVGGYSNNNIPSPYEDFFNGTIKAAGMYNRALNSTEREELNNLLLSL